MSSSTTRLDRVPPTELAPRGPASRTGRSRIPVQALTKAEAAYREVHARILEGALEPGSTLNQESLAATLGLSITPLREALRRLEAEGLVELRTHAIVSVVPLTAKEFEELCLVRAQLDPLAAKLAADHAGDAEIERITLLADAPVGADRAAMLAAHREFHYGLYAAAHNEVLSDILCRLWDRTDRYRIILLGDENFGRSTEAQHSEIVRVIRTRDGAGAAAILQRHVQEALQATLQMVQRRVDPPTE